MTNMNALRGAIAEAGYNISGLAEQLGMSRFTISKRLKGEADFTIDEASRIAGILNLTEEQKQRIFPI
jgi:plasmid maintenance system antidote protein VapI